MNLNLPRLIRAFSLIEILVIISILGILATVVIINLSGSSASARDAQRQSDLRNLQAAIETYKNENGRYPFQATSTAPGNNGWSGEIGTNFAPDDGSAQYIVGLAPQYISVLPRDPKRSGPNSGYVYRTNAAGTVYKLMVMNTVESEKVTYNHPLKSCDIRPDQLGRIQNNNNVDVSGWCFRVATGPATFETPPSPLRCRMNTAPNSDGGDGRFEKSYGVWGGFAALTTGAATSSRVRDTTVVTCK